MKTSEAPTFRAWDPDRGGEGMSAPEAETPPPLVVGQEGWFIPRDYRRGGLKSEGRPARVDRAGRVWAWVQPFGHERVRVVMATGAGWRGSECVGQWMTAAAYALWLAKAAADSERGELVEALRVKGITVNSSVKTDVLPRLLAALGE